MCREFTRRNEMVSGLDLYDKMDWFDYAKFLTESACADSSQIRRAFSQSELTREVTKNSYLALPTASWIFDRIRENPHARPEAVYGTLFSIAEIVKNRPDMQTRDIVEEMLEKARPESATSSRLTPCHRSPV
jgi:hypothetical protein